MSNWSRDEGNERDRDAERREEGRWSEGRDSSRFGSGDPYDRGRGPYPESSTYGGRGRHESNWSGRENYGGGRATEAFSGGRTHWNPGRFSGQTPDYGTDGGRGPHYGKGPKGYQRSDERMKEDISERLTREGSIDPSDVEVTVQNGEVTLSGTVADRRTKREIEDLCENCSGVKDVHNNVRVRSSNEGRDWSSSSERGSESSSSGMSSGTTSGSTTGGNSSKGPRMPESSRR